MKKKDDIETNWRAYVDENVRSGIVELLMLHLLTERDMYGYEIRQELEKRTGKIYILKEGTMYVSLYRMESRGLIESYKEYVVNNRFRMYYRINESGREYLAYGKQQIYDVFGGIDMLFKWEGEDNDKASK